MTISEAKLILPEKCSINLVEFLLQLPLAILTAALTIGGLLWLFHHQKKIQDNHTRQCLSAALLAEITSLLDRYWEIAGKQVDAVKDGEFWSGYFRPGESWFTVYSQNADKLGLFEASLVKKIVEVYTHANGFASRLRAWDDLFARYEKHEVHPESSPYVPKEQLVHWFGLLQKDQRDLIDKVNALKPSLQAIADKK